MARTRLHGGPRDGEEIMLPDTGTFYFLEADTVPVFDRLNPDAMPMMPTREGRYEAARNTSGWLIFDDQYSVAYHWKGWTGRGAYVEQTVASRIRANTRYFEEDVEEMTRQITSTVGSSLMTGRRRDV
jgi:hypothetical protein